jgi:hypothetical protein
MTRWSADDKRREPRREAWILAQNRIISGDLDAMLVMEAEEGKYMRIRRETDEAKPEFGDEEVLPIFMNGRAFIKLRDDQCFETT